MFSYCTFETIDISSFDTSNVTKMFSMFNGCTSLKNLDLSRFNTSNVTDMHSMFNQCTSLTSLDLRNFDTRNVTVMTCMFQDSKNLKTIYAKRNLWSTAKATTTYMFRNCGTSSVTYI